MELAKDSRVQFDRIARQQLGAQIVKSVAGPRQKCRFDTRAAYAPQINDPRERTLLRGYVRERAITGLSLAARRAGK